MSLTVTPPPTKRKRGRPRGSLNKRTSKPDAPGVQPITMKADTLAQAFGISRSLVKQWVAENKVRSTKIGQMRLIYVDSVLEMLKRGERAP